MTVADLDHGETNGGDLVVTAAVTNGSLTLGSYGQPHRGDGQRGAAR